MCYYTPRDVFLASSVLNSHTVLASILGRGHFGAGWGVDDSGLGTTEIGTRL